MAVLEGVVHGFLRDAVEVARDCAVGNQHRRRAAEAAFHLSDGAGGPDQFAEGFHQAAGFEFHGGQPV